MLFLSQPIGVGFSYAYKGVSASQGRFGGVNPYRFETTQLAAVGTWEVLQGFLANLPRLDARVKSRTFNLWTESYGGHYGPAFFDYFEGQNAAIENGTAKGVKLTMDTLGVGNGIISELIQAPFYPEFAR